MYDPISRLSVALDGRYRIERELGEGGMATVYLAVDLRLDRRVALKVLNPELTAVVAGRRFLSEIRTTANLHHPHILPLFESGEAGGFLYYVMPLVEGESLRDRLERERELPIDEAVRIAIDVAEALDYAHRQGVIHRDIKPGNIMLDDGQAVISDFGIALAVNAAGANRVTGTGNSVGTPYYMSPEQAAPSGDLDGRADMYSLACVLHEMLTGEPVFTGPSTRAVLAKHLAVPPVPVRALRSAVPRGVEQTLLRALEKTPADRFPTMRDFAAALEHGAASSLSPATAWVGLTESVRRHPAATTAAALVLAGTFAIAAPLLFSGPAWTDRPSSVVVLPFRESTSTEEEAALAVEVTDALSRELQSWDGVSVATSVDQAGPRRDLGLSEPTLERAGDGLALAQAIDAQAMIALTVRRRADSVSLEASVFDSRSRRRVGEPLMASGLVADLRDLELLAPFVAGVLGFDEAPRPSRALRAGTRNVDAAAAYLRGRAALDRNRVDEAELLFTRAVQLDSTFASALSFLGQSHFWRGVEDEYLTSRGPEISRWSTAAMRHLDGLSPANDGHVRGFYALQLGEFEEARQRYGLIVQADTADAYAQVMLGEIELHDKWSVRDVEGRLVPRPNFNRARRAFSAAVRVEPGFELAYGQMFAVQRELEKALRGGCDGFEETRGEARPVWRPPIPSDRMYPLCPAALDSLTWIPYAEFNAADRALLRSGADRLFRQFVGELERWANFAPNQPRPLELLSETYILQRDQLELTAPEHHQSLAAEALRYRSRALALQPDTAPADLVDLSLLHLAAGELESATEHARNALARYLDADSEGVVAAPPELLGVLAAMGQTSAALSVAERLPNTGAFIPQRYLTDPQSGESIPVGEGARVILRLRVMGASGTGGDQLRSELQRLDRIWAAAGYSARWRQLLRDAATMEIAPALTFDSLALAQWSGSVSHDDPAWLALSSSASDPARAREELQRGLAARERRLHSSFILATAAGRLGMHAEAIQLYSRLDSLPRSVVAFDAGWGLQVMSHFLRAEHYEHLGDVTTAREHYRRFVDAVSWPDSLSAELLERARERMVRSADQG